MAAAHAKTVILLHPDDDEVRCGEAKLLSKLTHELSPSQTMRRRTIVWHVCCHLGAGSPLPTDCPHCTSQAAEVHKTATLVSLQSCRSHPSTTLRPQRVVLQNPEAPTGSASAAQQASHALVQRSFKLVEVNG